MFKRAKNGPLPYNVEYTLKPLACKVRPLTAEERQLVAAEKTIDEKYPRPKVSDVQATLDRILKGDAEDTDSSAQYQGTDKEAVNELGN